MVNYLSNNATIIPYEDDEISNSENLSSCSNQLSSKNGSQMNPNIDLNSSILSARNHSSFHSVSSCVPSIGCNSLNNQYYMNCDHSQAIPISLTFIGKLYEICAREDLSDIIQWHDDGCSWRILSEYRFASEVLPLYVS